MGLRRIQSAIAKVQAKHADLRIDIKFAPFLLDSTLPTTGTSKRGRYIEKYGAARFETMEKEMIARGRIENIEFSYGGLISATFACHRLVEKAFELGGSQKQVALVENLFAACELFFLFGQRGEAERSVDQSTADFEKEMDIGDHEVLARASEEVGVMNRDAALAFLSGNELQREVEAGVTKAQARGISGVPFTIINGKLAISGAQEEATFVEVFEKLVSGELKV